MMSDFKKCKGCYILLQGYVAELDELTMADPVESSFLPAC